MGIAFTLAGIGGFLPIITVFPASDAPHLHVSHSHGELLGLFPINLAHNLFHLGIGVFGLYAYKSYATSLWFARIFGISLTILTIMGMIPALNTIFGLMPIYSHDIWLHGLEAVAGLYLGFGMNVAEGVEYANN